MRFPGQYFDVETELHQNGYRDYDPKRGRYIEVDPIGLMGGLNSFAYVQNNPVNFIDPWGLEGFDPNSIKFPLIYNFIDPPNEPMTEADFALQFLPVGSVGKITGFTKHGLNQAICRDGVGVASKEILNAVNNPTKVVEQLNGAVKYIGENATVILNRAGEVITTWARNVRGWRMPK